MLQSHLSTLAMPERGMLAVPEQDPLDMPEWSTAAVPEQGTLAMPEWVTLAVPEWGTPAMLEQSTPMLVVLEQGTTAVTEGAHWQCWTRTYPHAAAAFGSKSQDRMRCSCWHRAL